MSRLTISTDGASRLRPTGTPPAERASATSDRPSTAGRLAASSTTRRPVAPNVSAFLRCCGLRRSNRESSCEEKYFASFFRRSKRCARSSRMRSAVSSSVGGGSWATDCCSTAAGFALKYDLMASERVFRSSGVGSRRGVRRCGGLICHCKAAASTLAIGSCTAASSGLSAHRGVGATAVLLLSGRLGLRKPSAQRARSKSPPSCRANARTMPNGPCSDHKTEVSFDSGAADAVGNGFAGATGFAGTGFDNSTFAASACGAETARGAWTFGAEAALGASALGGETALCLGASDFGAEAGTRTSLSSASTGADAAGWEIPAVPPVAGGSAPAAAVPHGRRKRPSPTWCFCSGAVRSPIASPSGSGTRGGGALEDASTDSAPRLPGCGAPK
mmetsp:Transcript_17627/g.50740  ORF Transcript_17627/g.50740 Transcript_17627/m.50740 type:complete len:389 (+) Transcript_17627:1163-2329(+)